MNGGDSGAGDLAAAAHDFGSDDLSGPAATDLATSGDLAAHEDQSVPPYDFGGRTCASTCGQCPTSACCGGGCCASGEWCENGACRCGTGAACAPGMICAAGGAVGQDTCGFFCCGMGVPCPL